MKNALDSDLFLIRALDRSSLASSIPIIIIDLVDDEDTNAEKNRIPKINKLNRRNSRRKIRRRSCPPSLYVPSQSALTKKKFEAQRPKTGLKKDLTQGIGMSKILNTIERRRLKKARKRNRKLAPEAALS